ncbi:hypothetical protein F1880_001267 [Penicillium rolfsii]|nr:hypothetical protein F1880_001267 [Penicillium rolfsii]
MVIVWTPEWDNKLLVAIWETCGSKFDWETTAEIMGGTCTPEAIMQHLRTITRKAAERRYEQRQILLEAHAARAASVAKGKAKRKWGYNRSALKRIEELGQGYDSDVSAGSKSRSAQYHRSIFDPLSDSADVPAADNNSHVKIHQKGTKRKSLTVDEATKTSALQLEIEARNKSRRRGTFWNNYQRQVPQCSYIRLCLLSEEFLILDLYATKHHPHIIINTTANMPMSWSPEADARLLIAIINTTSNINWDAAASFLGSDCTVSAIKHRVARLKEKAGLPAAPRANGGKAKRATCMKASKESLEQAKAKSNAKTSKKEKAKSKANAGTDDEAFEEVADSNDGEVQESPADDQCLDY